MNIHDATETAYKNGYEKGRKDALLDPCVIVLPCKVGDVVYEVRNNTDACDNRTLIGFLAIENVSAKPSFSPVRLQKRR